MTLAESGATVLVADVVESVAETVSKEINSNGGSARPFTVDVSDVCMVTPDGRSRQAISDLRPSPSSIIGGNRPAG